VLSSKSCNQPVRSRVRGGLWFTQVAFSYFKIGFQTLRREWFGIDRLRLDKFLLLVRRLAGRVIVLMKASNW
jgi:Nucleolar protein,Nop52